MQCGRCWRVARKLEKPVRERRRLAATYDFEEIAVPGGGAGPVSLSPGTRRSFRGKPMQ